MWMSSKHDSNVVVDISHKISSKQNGEGGGGD